MSVTQPDGNVRSYHYENPTFQSHLTGISFNGIRYSTFSYDDLGRAVLTEHAGGMERHRLAYNANATTTVTDANGTATTYHFVQPQTGQRFVSREVGPYGTRALAYDLSSRQLTSVTDERGNKTSYTYDTYHRTSMTEADGTPQARTTTYQYLNDLSDLPTLVEKPSVYTGQKSRTAISYQDIRFPSLPTSITQSGYTPAGAPVSRTVGVTYNLNGQVSEIDGPRTDVADITRYDYYLCNTGGNCGQLRTVTNALGQITRYEDYDAAGRVGRIVAPNGLTTSYTYDPVGRVSQTVASSGGASRTTALTYTPAGDIATVTQPDGVQLTYTYDSARKLRSVTDSHGNKVEYDYDARGNRTKEDLFNPDGTQVNSRSYAYDLRNRVQSLNNDIDATRTSITTLVSDAVGNLLSEKDPNTNAAGGTLATHHEYDSLNRLFRTTDVKFGVTSYDYDVNDQVIAVAAPNNAVTTYAYDDLGNRLSEDSPDRGLTHYAYDAAGNLISRQNARGVTALFSYDALNRVTAVDYPGSEEDVQFGYDCPASIGRRCQVIDSSGTQVFEHDGFGNVLKHTRSGTWGSFVTEYTYDAGSRVSQVTASSGTQATYTRDDLGRVIGVRATVDGQQKALISGRNYRADGLPTAQFFGNGLVESRSYDLSGRLKQINLAGEVWNHEYDWNSNLTLRQSPAGTDQFEYDELDRLDGFTIGNLSPASYTYDKNGNRLSETLNGATYQHDYFNASNRLLSRAGSPVSHDEVGNRTSHGLRTLTYNSANRLYQVLEQGLVVATYVYNGLGQRVQKITNSGTTLYHYGLDGELVAETNASARLRDYIWLDGQPLAQVEAGGDTLFLHTDHLATPRRASNASGEVVWRWDSTPFGETSPSQDPDGNGLATIVNLRFPGQYYDSESGLHYNYFRDYDPQTGRYVESDPIGLEGGLNTYGYTYQNPINNFDPDGRAVWFLGFLFAGTGTTASTGTGVLLTGTALTGTALVGSSMLMTGSTPTGGSSTASAGGGNGDYCLLYPNDPICKQDFNPDQCPGISNKNLKHTGKHLPQFQQLDPAFTLQNQVNLGQRIASNPSNFVGASGGRSAYQTNATIGGKSVPVRVVVNSSNNIRTVYIVD
ncbi:RHS repeat-associated core domain-containing protein [Pseudomonas paralcaligenes]|uniref:RHS repeat-associated core domain-containing protein n=1 Tax=Pseudomonas paralcaligenes TaxID=2772558 RepID=UPI001C807553|nr:RHS repeat-associated core domain-containing protein [Pseudomonas paralcaligenes]